jgi:uncharacterized protein YcbK (DUF882 family)
MRRIWLILFAALCASTPAIAGPQAKHAPQNKGTIRQCDGGKCKRTPVLSGHNAAKQTLRADPLDKPSGHIHLRAENLGEDVEVDIYKADGSFDEGSLAKLDELFRDPKVGEVRAVRRELFEQLSRVQDHFEGKTVFLVSGFRFQERDSSRHFHASAMDIRIPGVSIYEMYKYCESLDPGGMGLGIYPTSGFIHFDYRAPGEPSYRWTDYSGHGGGGGKKKPAGHTQPARKPTS